MTLLAGNKRAGRRRAGFTLVELILVMVLLVVAVSMVAPRMTGFIRGRALGSEARRMLALMHAAQSRAVSEGTPVLFWVDGKLGEYGMAQETPPTGGDPQAEQVDASDNLQLAVVNAGVTAMTTYLHQGAKVPAARFQPDGTVDEDSPKMFRILSADGGSLWLVEAKSRTGYEISDTGN